MAATNRSQTSTTGTNSMVQAAGPGVVWNLTYLTVSFAGPTAGPNAKVTVYDGTAAAGTVIFQQYLAGPSGSVGTTHKIDIPVDALGRFALQASPDAVMTIVVDGFGANRCTINARFTDGLP